MEQTAHPLEALARTKIQPPHPKASSLVARPALEAALVDSLMAHRVVLLHAAAGFGKSLLLARAVERLPGRCVRVWISLDDGDTLRSVMECLVTALEPYDPPWRTEPTAWVAALGSPGAPALHAAAATFINTLLAIETSHGVLVLDDLHRVNDAPLMRFLEVLVERLAPGWSIAIASRSAPPFSLGRLAAQGELAVWREASLSLSHEETLHLCAQLPAGVAETIWERTGGWPAGVRLALAAVGSAASPTAAGQIDRSVFDFFASEVIDRLHEELRRFLLQISLLPEVTAAQAAAITQNANAARLFDEIERRALFAVDVGTSERTLRLHDLFREALARRLAIEPGVDRQLLLRRAAQIESDPVRRIGFLVRAEDWSEAASAFAACAPDWLLAGAADQVQRLLRDFPHPQQASLPELSYVEGLVALSRWDWARIPPLMRRAAALWREAGDTAQAAQAESLVPLALAGLGENRSAQAHLDLPTAPDLGSAARLRRAVTQSWLRLSEGALDATAASFRETVDILVTSDAPPHLWQQAQPLPAFIGLPGTREPLRQWVQGALRRSPEAPTSLRGMATVLRGWLLLRGGDLAGAWAACEEAHAECLWLHEPQALAFQVGLLKAQLLALQPRGDELGRHLQAMLERSARAEDRQHRSAATGLLLYLGARCAHQAGDTRLALDLAGRLLREPEAVGGWIRPDALFGIRAIVAECEGAPAVALALWRRQLAIEGTSDLFGQGAEARLHAAALATILEDRRAALDLLAPLLARCLSDGEPGVLQFASPQVRRRLAEQDWGLQLPAPLKALLVQARPTAALGIEADAVAADRAAPGAATNAAFAAAGLSGREVEVLARVADGASNKQIAREFDLSPFTVKRHVGNILNKLALGSRGQAAAWYRDQASR